MTSREAAAKFREIYEFINADTLALGAHEHPALVRGIALDVSLSRTVREHALHAIEQESFACGLSDDLSGNAVGGDANRLRSAVEFAIKHLDSMDEYSIVTGAIHVLSEALKQSKKPNVADDTKPNNPPAYVLETMVKDIMGVTADRDAYKASLTKLHKICDEIIADRDRLREALDFIASGCLVPPDGGTPNFDDAIKCASEALKGV